MEIDGENRFPEKQKMQSGVEVKVIYESYRSGNEKCKTATLHKVTVEEGKVKEFQAVDRENSRLYTVRVNYRDDLIIESENTASSSTRKSRLGDVQEIEVIE